MGQGITNSILLMLVIMLSINVGLAFTQTAVDDLATLSILNQTSSPLKNYYIGDNLSVGVSNITADMLPSSESVTEGESSSFTDIFVSLKSYVNVGLSSIGFIANVLVQPAGFLRDVGFPYAICLAVQIIWSMMFLLFVVAWIMGRT